MPIYGAARPGGRDRGPLPRELGMNKPDSGLGMCHFQNPLPHPNTLTLNPPPGHELSALEATQGQMNGFFSQLPYKCYLEM